MVGDLTADFFEKQLQKEFIVKPTGDVELSLKLVDVKRLNRQRKDATRDPFSIIFQGPAQPLLEQAVYEFLMPSLEPMGIFIVPIGAGENFIEYEAIFS